METKKLSCGCKVTWYEVSRILLIDKKCKAHNKWTPEIQDELEKEYHDGE